MAQTLNVVFSSAGQLAVVGVFQWLTWRKADVDEEDRSRAMVNSATTCRISHDSESVLFPASIDCRHADWFAHCVSSSFGLEMIDIFLEQISPCRIKQAQR